jgi:hypothetical protein
LRSKKKETTSGRQKKSGKDKYANAEILKRPMENKAIKQRSVCKKRSGEIEGQGTR